MCSQGHRLLMSDSEGRNAGQSRAHASVLRPGQCLPQRPGQRMNDLSRVTVTAGKRGGAGNPTYLLRFLTAGTC